MIFTSLEVREALDVGSSGLGEDPPPGYTEGMLRLPPAGAIAYQLVKAVVSGYLDGAIGSSRM